MSELPEEIKEAVAYSAKNWPRTLNAESLLRELDALARRVHVLTSTASESTTVRLTERNKTLEHRLRQALKGATDRSAGHMRSLARWAIEEFDKRQARSRLYDVQATVRGVCVEMEHYTGPKAYVAVPRDVFAAWLDRLRAVSSPSSEGTAQPPGAHAHRGA